jgi:hypothetical protein
LDKINDKNPVTKIVDTLLPFLIMKFPSLLSPIIFSPGIQVFGLLIKIFFEYIAGPLEDVLRMEKIFSLVAPKNEINF